MNESDIRVLDAMRKETKKPSLRLEIVASKTFLSDNVTYLALSRLKQKGLVRERRTADGILVYGITELGSRYRAGRSSGGLTVDQEEDHITDLCVESYQKKFLETDDGVLNGYRVLETYTRARDSKVVRCITCGDLSTVSFSKDGPSSCVSCIHSLFDELAEVHGFLPLEPYNIEGNTDHLWRVQCLTCGSPTTLSPGGILDTWLTPEEVKAECPTCAIRRNGRK